MNKTIFLFLNCLVLFSFSYINVRGQSAGDFQTYQTGNWNDVNTWERYSGTSWINPAPYTPTYNDGVITIRNGHTVTITAEVKVDQTVVEAGGILILNAKLSFNDITGSEVTVSGILINNYDISSGGQITFSSGSTYRHNINYENIPNGIWDANSTIEITGVTTDMPYNLEQSFGHFTYNCPNQQAGTDESFSSGFHTFGGNFTITSTGSGKVHFTSNEATTVSIGGNFVMTGGTLRFAYSGSDRQINVAGDYSMSGGTLELGGYSLVGTLNISGDFSHTGGTITELVSGSGAIVFTGAGTHTYTSGGTIANTINFTINNGSTLQMASESTTITGDGSFTLSSGATLGITSPNGITTSGASGNIQVTGTRTYSSGANYIYNGTSSQSPGNGLPSPLNNLNINNSAGVTLNTNITINGILTLTNGYLTLGSNVITLAGYLDPINGGSSSSYIVTNGTGTFTRNSVGSSTDYLFPVGTTTSYNPVIVNNSGTTDNFSVKVQSTFDYAPDDTSKVVKRQWTIDEATPGGSSATITFYFNSGEWGNSFSTSNPVVIGKWDGIAWVHYDATLSGTGPYAVINSSPVTSFSPFVVGNDGALPVELTSFTSTVRDRNVMLRWSTAVELNNAGFEVERKLSDGSESWTNIGFVQGNGTTNEPKNYSFEDKKLNTGKYGYRLKQIDYNNKETVFNLNNIVEVGIPKNPELSQNYPNPFNPVTKIDYNITYNSKVTLKIFDITGREISTLVNETMEAGYYTVQFNAYEFASATYFYRLSTEGGNENFVMTKRMILIK